MHQVRSRPKTHTRQELYTAFMEFLIQHIQGERKAVNRRMFHVFFWCFILPAVVSSLSVAMIKLHILPGRAKSYLDWVVLAFPICYGMYVLSSEVLMELPSVFRKGGIAGSLTQAAKDSAWREQVCERLKVAIDGDAEEWEWISTSFRMDLDKMQHRNRYMTGLAGAVFFLIMQGIDSLGDAEVKVTWIKSPMGWMEAPSADLSQWLGLALFLLLLYLSGNQTYHSLLRYLNCAELMRKRSN